MKDIVVMKSYDVVLNLGTLGREPTLGTLGREPTLDDEACDNLFFFMRGPDAAVTSIVCPSS
jgi:hypothetical protein